MTTTPDTPTTQPSERDREVLRAITDAMPEGFHTTACILATYRAEIEAAARADERAKRDAEIGQLSEALVKHNDRLRSAISVADRDGKDTNWLPFRGHLRYTAAQYHELVNECRERVESGEIDRG